MSYLRRNLDWRCERGILWLVIGMLGFAPMAFGAVDAWAFLVLQVMTAGVLGLWTVRLWTHPKPRLLWPPLCWVVSGFMLYALARYFTADIEYVARMEVLQTLMFGFVFLAAMNNLRGQEEISAVTAALVAAGTVAACYAAVQMIQHSNQVWNQVSPYIGRASGTYISPNNLAGLLAMLLPLAVSYLLAGKVSVVTRILLSYAVLAMGAGLAVTFSRGGYIAASAGLLLLLGILLCHGNHRLKAGLLLALLLAAGGVYVSQYLSKTVGYMRRVSTPEQGGGLVIVDASTDSRLQMWGAAARMWGDHVWWGVGPAHFDHRFREYRPELLQARPDRVHNDYLNLLADWGVVGGVIVLAGLVVLILWLARTWPHVRRDENAFGTGQSNRFAFFLGAMCGLAALAVHSFMDFNLHIPANALAGVVLLALLASTVRHATEQFWIRVRRPAKAGLTAVLGLMICVLGVQTWRGAGEAFWLVRADRVAPFSPEQAAALEKALAYESRNHQTAYDFGECFRIQSLEGGADYEELARKALSQYALAIRSNPHDGYGYLRTGMCLDWLGQTDKSAPYYKRAEACDPNGYFMVANIGWHYVQIGNYSAAREWFERSLRLSQQSDIARNYLAICDMKQAQNASRMAGFPPPKAEKPVDTP